MTDVGGGPIRTPPGERDNAVAKGPHGLGVLAGVYWAGFGGLDDLFKTHNGWIGFL